MAVATDDLGNSSSPGYVLCVKAMMSTRTITDLGKAVYDLVGRRIQGVKVSDAQITLVLSGDIELVCPIDTITNSINGVNGR